MAIQFKGDWLMKDFDFGFEDEAKDESAAEVILRGMSKGYGIEKWHDPQKAWPTYGLWRAVGPNKGRVSIGTFAHPEELIAMLKLILASEE